MGRHWPRKLNRPSLPQHPFFLAAILLFVVTLTPAAANAALDAPVLQNPSAFCSGSNPFVTLAWSSVTGATSYEVFRDGGATPVATVAATTYDDAAVNPKEIHTYTIRATSSTETSSASNAGSITVPRCGPVLSIAGRSCLVSGPKIDLLWNSLAGVTGYQVLRNGAPLADLAASQTNYADTAIVGAQSYAYTVRAIWPDESKDSNTPPLVKAPACPPTLTANGNCQAPGAQASLSWIGLAGVTEYQVFKNGSYLTSVSGTTFSDQAVQQRTSYSYVIRAVYSTETADSNSAAATIPRCAPVLTAQNACNLDNPTIPEVLLSWTPTANASLYDIYETLKGFVMQVVSSPATIASFLDGSKVANNTSYTFSVNAIGSFETLISNSASVTPNCSASVIPSPAPVLAVAPVCVAGASQMSLTWTPSNSVLYYTIDRRNNSTGETRSRNVSSAATSDTDVNIEVGVSYTYTVTAVGNGGGAASNAVTKTSVDCTPPSTPTLSVPAPLCVSGQPVIKLAWVKSTNTTRYEVWRNAVKINEIADPNTTTYADVTVTNSTTYNSPGYEVRAIGPGGTAFSGAKPATAPNCASPSAPVLSVAAPVCAGSSVSIGLSWTPSTNVSYYTVYRKRTGDASFSAIVPSTTATSYSDTGLAQGLAEVSYFVTAFGQPGTNPATSNLVTRSTPYCPPSTPTLSVVPACSLGNPIMNLSWTAAINITSYKIKRDGVEIGAVTPPTTTFSDNTSLVSGSSYAYTVSAVGPGGVTTSSPVSKTALTCAASGKPVVAWSALCSASNPRVQLTWSPTANTVSYDVFRGATKLTATPISFSSGATSYSFTDTSTLNANTNYSYTVAANGLTGVSPTSSDIVPARTSYCQPSKPVPTVTALCSSGKAVFKVSWTDSTPSNTTSYEVRRNGALVAPSILPPTLTYTDDNSGAGFVSGTVNTYIVTAVGPGGTGRTDSDSKLSPPALNCASPDQPVISGLGLACTGGKALYFSRANGDYINLGNPNDLRISGSQTIEMWIKPDTYDGNRQNPYAKAYGGEGTITLETAGGLSYYYGTCGGDCSPYDGYYSTNVIPANTWSHIAVVRDLDSNPKKVRWFVNGVLDSEKLATHASAGKSSNTAYIGKGYVSNFKGYLDEVRVYDRALSSSEVFTHYNGSSGQYGSPESGLKGGWHFDEGSGTTAADFSGGNNNGTLVNGPTRVENQVAYQGVGPSPFQQVRIDWNSASNASYYDVYRGATRIAKVTALNPQPASYTYYDISYYSTTNILTTGSSYAYKVTAVNSSTGASSASPTVTSAAMPLCSPTKPAWVASYPRPVCSGDNSTVQTAWTYAQPYSHTKNFEIQRSGGAGGTTTQTVPASGSGSQLFTDTNGGAGLASGVAYTYQITGVGSTGLRNDSASQTTTTLFCSIPAPDASSQCTVSAYNPVTNLTWQRVPTETTFYLYRKKASESVFSLAQWAYNYSAASPTTFREWLVLGPFPNSPDPTGYNTDSIAQGTVNTASESTVKPRGGETIGGKTWTRLLLQNTTDYVDLNAFYGTQSNVVGYAFAYMVNTTGAPVTGELRLGSDDGIKAYLNGVKIHDNHVHRTAVRDQDKPPTFPSLQVTLNPGVNTILLKIDQGGGGWGFYARLTDSSGNPLLPTITSTDSGMTQNTSAQYFVWTSPGSITSPTATAPGQNCAPGKATVTLDPACDAGRTTMGVRWNPTPSTASYTVYRVGSASALNAVPIAYDPAQPSYQFTDQNLEEERNYSYTVTSTGNGTVSSDPVSATSVLCAFKPDSPQLTAADVTPICAGTASRVRLDWPDAANAISYTVHRNNAPLTPSVSSSAFTDGSVTAGNQYAYKIEAVGSGGSSFSGEVTVTALDCSGPPVPPTLNQASVLFGPTSVFLRWTDNSRNELGFRIHRTQSVAALDSFFARLLSSVGRLALVLAPELSTDTTAFTDTTPAEDTTYEYRVEAFNDAGSTFSNAKTVSVPIAPPGSFTVLLKCSINQNPKRIALDWRPGADTTGKGGPVTYNAFWANNELGPYTLLPAPCSPDISGTSCTVDIPAEGLVWYKVTARNVGGTTDALSSSSCEPLKWREIIPE